MPFFKNKSKRLRQRQRIKSRNDPNNDNPTDLNDDEPHHPRHGTMTSILKQLSYKLFMYGFVFIFLKGYATKNKSNNMKANDATGDDYRISNTQLSSPIYVLKNLLPSDVADKWHDQLSTIWNEKDEKSNRRAAQNDVVNDNDKDNDNDNNISRTTSSWNFVTNNNGNINKNNDQQQQQKTTQKVKTFKNIKKRNETAQQMYANNQFSYAHWELDDTHSIMDDMGRLFLKGTVKKRLMGVITELINDSSSNASEDGTTTLGRKREFTPQSLQLSIMNFDTGNFLLQYSDHVDDDNDNSSAAWAVILSLSKRRRRRGDDESLARAGGNSNKMTNNSTTTTKNNNDHNDDDAGDITFRFSCRDDSSSGSSLSRYDDDDTKLSSSESSPNNIRGPLTTRCETIRSEFNEALIFSLPSKGHYFEVSPVSYRRRAAAVAAVEDDDDDADNSSSSNESENFILALLIRGEQPSSSSSSSSPRRPSHKSKEVSGVDEL